MMALHKMSENCQCSKNSSKGEPNFRAINPELSKYFTEKYNCQLYVVSGDHKSHKEGTESSSDDHE